MNIIERQIQKVRSGKWTELDALDKKFTAVERGLGFPVPVVDRWRAHHLLFGDGFRLMA